MRPRADKLEFSALIGPLEKGAVNEVDWGFLSLANACCCERETLRHGLRRAISLFKGGSCPSPINFSLSDGHDKSYPYAYFKPVGP